MANMMSPGRVQAPDLNLNSSLTPAPIVAATPVAPQNTQGAGSNLLRIADSLSQLGAPLSSFSQALYAQRQKDQQLTAQTDQTLTYDQQLQRLKDNPALMKNEAYQTMMGSTAANSLGPQIDKWAAEEWDSTKEDYKTFVTRKLSEVQSTLPSDYAKASFGSQSAAWVDRAYTSHMAEVTKTSEDNMGADVLNFYTGLIARGKMEKKPVDQIWGDIVSASNDTRSFFALSGQKQNDLLLSLAQKVAESGDKEMAAAILDGARGADGKVPALSSIPDLAAKVDAVRNGATQKWTENHVSERSAAFSAADDLSKSAASNDEIKAWDNKYGQYLTPAERTSNLAQMLAGRDKRQMSTNWASDGQLQRTKIDDVITKALIAGDGWQKFDKVQINSDKTYGDTIDYDVEKRVDELANKMVDNLYAADPASAPIRAAQFLSANNRTYGTWTSIFNAVTPQAIATAATSGQLSPPIQKAVELYSQLHGQYDGLIARHITSDQKNVMGFLESYRINHEELGMSPQDALALVASHQGPAGDSVRGQAYGEVARSFYGNSSVNVDSSLSANEAKDVMDMAVELSINTRLRGDAAVNAAWEQYQTTHTQVLGSWVPKNDPRIPSNVSDIMDSYATDWIAAHGNQVLPPITDKSELGVQYVNGQFVLTHADGSFIEMHNSRPQDPEQHGVYETITMPKLADYWNTKQKEQLGADYKSAAEDILGTSTGYGGVAPRYSPENLFGVTDVTKVGTLNLTQLEDIVKLRDQGKLPTQFTTPEFTSAINKRLKEQRDFQMALIQGMAN